MNVLVYTGPDTSPTSLSHTLTSLRHLLVPNYAVQTLDAKALPSQPWSASCALLVFPAFQGPGGAFSPAATKEIQNYVHGGGKLLSLGTAARVDQYKVPTMLRLTSEIAGLSVSSASPTSTPTPKIKLEDANLGLTFSLVPDRSAKEEASAIRLVDGAQLDSIQSTGEVSLPEPDMSAKEVEVLAHYIHNDASRVSAIKARVGNGLISFWGSHLEVRLASDIPQDKARLQALRITLQSLGLTLPSPPRAEDVKGDDGVVARPIPQVLSSAPWRTAVLDTIIHALDIPDLTASTSPYQLKDSNDTFLFYAQQEAPRVFAEQREAVKALGEDPATWNPKHIVVYKDGFTPSPNLTPQFNLETYYAELEKARKERGCPTSYPEGGWGVGEALLYGEIVTSTQTMLDRNTRLLSSLPTPLVSLASSQLTGRGRGGNVWLSPPGCLMFSLLLRVPLSALPATKIVFVQYLLALAVVEACRTDGVLGEETGSRVRIKWPNDIYVNTAEGASKKVGGILVNASFGTGVVELVAGCGLNVLNPPPISSLAQLLPEPRAGGHPLPTMERTLAAIMARFERMWAEFVRERGSFSPFMELYYERWLHSDQQVTLTTVTPHRKVRILGITPDHGLLRTLPERDAWSQTQGGEYEYIDLQPDGNSFDLMAGLIKTKT